MLQHPATISVRNLGAVLIGVGIVLILHDLLFHLTGKFGLGREFRVRGVHLHHGYLGGALVLAGATLQVLR